MLRINEEIRTVKSIQKEFEEFREVVNLFKAKTRIVSDLVYAFDKQYNGVINELDSSRLEKEKQYQTTLLTLNEKLKPKQEELNREIGKRELEVEIQEKQFISLQTQLDEIASFEGKKFLEEFGEVDDKELSPQEEDSVVDKGKPFVRLLIRPICLH